jgi:hypothetical protein
MKSLRIFIILSLAVLFINGCAGVPVRTNSQYPSYFQTQKYVYIVPSDVKQYKLTAGGVTEEMDEWEEATNEQLLKNVKRVMESSSRIKVTMIDEAPLDMRLKEFLRGQNGLYHAVAQSIILHTYTPCSIFKHKMSNFDYSLGSEINEISDFVSADTLLFIGGKRTYWTGGRIFLAACAMIAGAAVGVSVVPVPVPDWLAVSLVDSNTGDLVWFRYLGQPETAIGDLRETTVVEKSVDLLFKDLIK